MLTIHHCFLLEEDQHQVSKISQINLYQSTTGKCLICRSVSSLVFLIVNWSIWSWSQCNKTTKKEGWFSISVFLYIMLYITINVMSCFLTLMPVIWLQSHAFSHVCLPIIFPFLVKKISYTECSLCFSITWLLLEKCSVKKKSILEKKIYRKWLQITVWVRYLVVKSTEHQKHVTSRGQ